VPWALPQDVRELLKVAANEQNAWHVRIKALNDVSRILESEEERYQVRLCVFFDDWHIGNKHVLGS
jgi:hypothetical protein